MFKSNFDFDKNAVEMKLKESKIRASENFNRRTD